MCVLTLSTCAGTVSPSTATIHSEGSAYSATFLASKVLQDDGDKHGSIWLTPPSTNSWFIVDVAGQALSPHCNQGHPRVGKLLLEKYLEKEETRYCSLLNADPSIAYI